MSALCSVVMIRTAGSTHSVQMDQRMIVLMANVSTSPRLCFLSHLAAAVRQLIALYSTGHDPFFDVVAGPQYCSPLRPAVTPVPAEVESRDLAGKHQC